MQMVNKSSLIVIFSKRAALIMNHFPFCWRRAYLRLSICSPWTQKYSSSGRL